MPEKEVKRYFWKRYELTLKQYRALREINEEIFIETPDHPRTDDFIRKAWQ